MHWESVNYLRAPQRSWWINIQFQPGIISDHIEILFKLLKNWLRNNNFFCLRQTFENLDILIFVFIVTQQFLKTIVSNFKLPWAAQNVMLSLSPYVPFFSFSVLGVCSALFLVLKCFNRVPRKFEGCLKFQWCSKEVLRMFQGRFKDVSRKFLGYLQKVSRKFQGS